jgi:hypothetical protein
VCAQGYVRIDVAQSRGGGLQLGASDVRAPVQDLALQVAQVDGVEIDEPDAADPGGREIERERRAQAAGTHHQHACCP